MEASLKAGLGDVLAMINIKERIFRISGDNRGLVCLFKPIVCESGCCSECPIYLDWQERGEKVVMCGRCGEVMRRNPDFGRSVLLLGICDDCEQENARL